MRRGLLFSGAFVLLVSLGCEKLQSPIQPENAPPSGANVITQEEHHAQMKALRDAARAHADKLIAAPQTGRNLKRSQAQNQFSANNITVPDDYPTIQLAVDNASPGTKIRVKAGTYIEDVDIDVADVRITAEDAVTLNGHFVVRADEVTIDHFNIAPTGSFGAGIDVFFASGVQIHNNTFTGGTWGIFLIQSTGCIVKKNHTSAASTGIYLIEANGNSIVGNSAAAGQAESITIQDSDNNQTSGNQCNAQTFGGISLLGNSNDNEIKHNGCSNNGTAGISVSNNAHDNTIGPGNTANHNLFGITLDNSTSSNVVKQNTFLDNSAWDILNGGTGNTFLKNKAEKTSGI